MEGQPWSPRSGAADWSMACDKRLLETLQHMHQKIISKCSETGSQLQQMVTSLDEASITLHNANNKFMSLSNSQFIESRVFEDDTDLAVQKPAHTHTSDEVPRPAVPVSPSSCLSVLERLHERVTILPDSDSSSEDEDELIQVVLKPKDLYSSRPLPYIIGSHAWKTKWHAGLIVEDSDSDSMESKQSRGPELYSDSEPEDTPRSELGPRDEVSSGASVSSGVSMPVAVSGVSPADVAAQLARRLRGPLTDTTVPESVDSSPEQAVTVRKVYRPERPATAIIFPSEPPPLSESEQSEPEDIFAELQRQPKGKSLYDSGNTVQDAADDLFGFVEELPPSTHAAKRNETLLPKQSDPELLANRLAQEFRSDNHKKPKGGVSLFGNNESIGAAILNRHRRKSNSDESDDSCQTPVRSSKPQNAANTTVDRENKDETEKGVRKEKDLIQNLFAKPNEIKKKAVNTVKNQKQHMENNIQEKQYTDIFEDLFAKSQDVQKKEPVKEQKSVEKKPVLFSGNIFDDIDDMFTSNMSKVTLKEPRKEHVAKSLFDDEDNDLFSDVRVSIKENDKNNQQNTSKRITKSIFDSDDKLFSEKLTDGNKESNENANKLTKFTENKQGISKTPKPEIKTITAKNSLFDSDDEFLEKGTQSKSQSDVKDLLTPKVKDNQVNIIRAATNEIKIASEEAQSLFGDDDDSIFKNNEIANTPAKISKLDDVEASVENKIGSINAEKILNHNKLNIFGDEDEHLFSKTNKLKKEETTKNSDDKPTPLTAKSALFNSPNLFDSDDDLFIQSKSNQFEESDAKNLPDLEDKNAKLIKNESTNLESQNVHIKENAKINQDASNKLNSLTEVFDAELTKDEDDWDTEDKETAEFIGDAVKRINVTNDALHNNNIIHATKENFVHKPRPREFNTETITTPNENLIDCNKPSRMVQGIESKLLIKTPTPTVNKEGVSSEKTAIGTALFGDPIKHNNSGISNERAEVESEVSKPDILTDIFVDLPPVFEKPKEPKKSKNINALFDDDSDDEALFFKKNDNLVDDSEKLGNFSPGADVKLSGLFHDEPPAIDIDFLPKTSNVEVYIEKNKQLQPASVNVTNKKIDAADILTPNFIDGTKSSVESHKQVFETKDDLDGTIQKTENVESKRVGKLKPNINLNINVNTLLPGASPKKVSKPLEQPDSQHFNKSNNEMLKEVIDSTDSFRKLSKSISFDGEPDPSTLDSKLSKDRAKIQVKRRPSTRRARREAVKRSGIDFGEDITDNTSTIDDYNNTTADNIPTIRNIEVKSTERNEPEHSLENNDHVKDEKDIKHTTISADTIDRPITHSKTTQIIKDWSNIASNEVKNLQEESLSKDVKSKVVYILNDDDIFTDSKTVNEFVPSTQKEKAESSNVNEVSINVKNTKILNIVDDDDDDHIFKVLAKAEEDSESKLQYKEIKTLGKVYSEKETKTVTSKDAVADSDNSSFKDNTTSKPLKQSEKTQEQIDKKGVFTTKPKTSLFDDLSDSENELFGKHKSMKEKILENKVGNETKTVTENEMRTKSIFESDSDEELFGGKSKTKDRSKHNIEGIERRKKKALKKIEVRGSLFGDDDDDDNIFGDAKSNSESRLLSSKPSSSSGIQDVMLKQVFDDPLSLLRDE